MIPWSMIGQKDRHCLLELKVAACASGGLYEALLLTCSGERQLVPSCPRALGLNPLPVDKK